MSKPYAESCDQNREPIEAVLKRFVSDTLSVLEIGSGTGQHAVYFAGCYPWLTWQTTELPQHHAGIRAWISDSSLDNVIEPFELDVSGSWPDKHYDLIFTANTLHIISMDQAESLFRQVPRCMHENSVLIMYGPFNYQGRYTSPSNERFDAWLKQRDPASGIKNFDWLRDIAAGCGLECAHDFSMPANNRCLIWRKKADG